MTEWGVADLAGRSIRERALELIGVAHPRFRPWLLDAAKRLGYAWADQCIPAFDSPPGGEWESTFATAGGLVLRTRPARPPDERGLMDLLYALSEDDVRMRFMGRMRRFPRSVVQPMVVPDCEDRMALVATVDTTAGERILGVAHSIVDPATRMAEVAFIVAERWRRMGIGTQLLRELVRVGGGRGVSGLRAEMFPTNQAMIALFRKTGRRVHAAIEEDTYILWCMLDE
ncbi:MAG: GNAT family N-acetyltransferase [Myxococcota bacterium]|nr:GNAT family N-acetyltransferase [Myxococcota bacterium]